MGRVCAVLAFDSNIFSNSVFSGAKTRRDRGFCYYGLPMTTQSLTSKTIAALERVGATENLIINGNLITAADKWGDAWSALVAEDLDALVVPDLGEMEAGRHFVLVVVKGAEDAARDKL